MATKKTSNKSSALHADHGCSDEEINHGNHACSGPAANDRGRSSPMAESFSIDSTENDQRSNPYDHLNSKKSKSHTSGADHLCEELRGGSSSKKLKRSRGGATKRKDGRYVKYLELGRSPSGARIRRAFYGKTASVALAKYDRAKAAKLNGIVSLDDRTTFARFVEIYLNDIARGKCKPGTLTGYRDLLDHHVIPTIGYMRLLDIRVLHIEKIFTQMAMSGLSVGTIKAVRRVASSVFTAAERSEMVNSNPVAKTEVPKLKVGQLSRKPKPYSEEQLGQVVGCLSNRGFGAIFMCLMRTGMRRGEALALQWQDLVLVEDSGWEITISKQLQAVRLKAPDGQYSRSLEVNSPKTHAGFRQVPISNEYAQELLELQGQDMLDGIQPSGEGFIFHTSKGTPYDPDNVTKAWKIFLKKNNLPFTQLHGLRHTFATLALEKGSPLESVTEMLGHSSIKITKDLYAARVKGLARRSVDAFEMAYFTFDPVRGGIGLRNPKVHFLPRSPRTRNTRSKLEILVRRNSMEVTAKLFESPLFAPN